MPTDQFSSPSAFAGSIAGLSLRLTELHGHAPRTQTTQTAKATLAVAIVSSPGKITGFRLRAIEAGTTSSTTFNTIALFRALAGSITYTNIGTLRSNRGQNAGSSSMVFSGATALVYAGDVLVIRRLTKLNTASQLIASAEINKIVG